MIATSQNKTKKWSGVLLRQSQDFVCYIEAVSFAVVKETGVLGENYIPFGKQTDKTKNENKPRNEDIKFYRGH